MSERPRHPGAVGRLEAAAFDAALERATERLLRASADDSAGARVVARLLVEPQVTGGRLLWVPAAAFALLLAAVALPLRESASPADRSMPVGPVIAAAATPGPGASQPEAPDARGAAAPQGEPALAFVAAASRVAAPGARRRVRARAVAPSVEDDASTVPLLEVTGALRFAAGDDASGNPLAPPPLPVDALGLESLDLEALGLRRD